MTSSAICSRKSMVLLQNCLRIGLFGWSAIMQPLHFWLSRAFRGHNPLTLSNAASASCCALAAPYNIIVLVLPILAYRVRGSNKTYTIIQQQQLAYYFAVGGATHDSFADAETIMCAPAVCAEYKMCYIITLRALRLALMYSQRC